MVQIIQHSTVVHIFMMGRVIAFSVSFSDGSGRVCGLASVRVKLSHSDGRGGITSVSDDPKRPHLLFLLVPNFLTGLEDGIFIAHVVICVFERARVGMWEFDGYCGSRC